MKRALIMVGVVAIILAALYSFLIWYGTEYRTYCWGPYERCVKWKPPVCDGVSVAYTTLHGLSIPDGPDMVCFGKLIE